MSKLDQMPKSKLAPYSVERREAGSQSILTGLAMGSLLIVFAIAARNWPTGEVSAGQQPVKPFARDICIGPRQSSGCLPPNYTANDLRRIFYLPNDVAARVSVDSSGTIQFKEDK